MSFLSAQQRSVCCLINEYDDDDDDDELKSLVQKHVSYISSLSLCFLRRNAFIFTCCCAQFQYHLLMSNFIHHQVIEQQGKRKINKQLHNTHNKAKSTGNCHAHGPICQTTPIIGSATKRTRIRRGNLSVGSVCVSLSNAPTFESSDLESSFLYAGTFSEYLGQVRLSRS